MFVSFVFYFYSELQTNKEYSKDLAVVQVPLKQTC